MSDQPMHSPSSAEPAGFDRRFDAVENTRRFAIATLSLAALVIYGSLIPFEHNGLSFAAGLERFGNIRWLDFYQISRADWVANILLYIPVAYAAMGWLAAGDIQAHDKPLHYVLVLSGCMLLAFGLEFTQVFFSPRTYSYNDLLAEFLGTSAGLLLWAHTRLSIARLFQDLKGKGRRAIHAAGIAYFTIYLLQSLFPYDFVLSLRELEARFDSGMIALWMADGACASPLRCLMKPSLEILAATPLGMFLALSSMRTRIGVPVAAATGLVLGITLEIMQIFIISGTSQGLSVITRILGVTGGFWVLRQLRPERLRPLGPMLRPALVLAALPYFALILIAGGWAHAQWLSLPEAMDKLGRVSFLPFYYHYFSTESIATVSLLMNAALYAPLGAAVWLWELRAPAERTQRASHLIPILLVLPPALILETSKLFQAGRLPDYTNVLIGCLAALAAYSVLRWLTALAWPFIQRRSRSHRRTHDLERPPTMAETTPPARVESAAPRPNPHDPAPQVRAAETMSERADAPVDRRSPMGLLAGRTVSLLLAGCLVAIWLAYPIAQGPLALGLILYLGLLVYNPRAWLLVIPALIPALDLVPYSGWFYWESVDFFLLATLIFAYWTLQPKTSRVQLPRIMLIALALAFGIAMLRGLLPWSPLDANAFADYFSRYNALRVAKGFFWALLLLPLLKATLTRRADFTYYLLPGLSMGFFAVMLLVLWERHAFSGLFNFANDFRVTGSFSSMHTGGGHIEAYLSLVLPFLAAGMFARRLSAMNLALGALFLGLGGYALLVTFSRAGVLALLVSFGVVTLGLLRAFIRHELGAMARRLLVFAGLIAVLAATTIPIFQGSYLQNRFSHVQRDMGIRMAHWGESMAMMQDDLPTTLFGMGLGRFPESYLFHHLESNRLASFRFEQEDGNPFLRLIAGDSLYYEQIVDLKPETRYRLLIDLRSSLKKPLFTVPVCAKSFLYSYDCRWLSIPAIRGDGRWHTYEMTFQSGGLGEGSLVSRRTTKLSLYNPAGGDIIDVDNVRLLNPQGEDLLSNGDFSRYHDHWFFATDNHLPWHIKQLWLQVYFEQGLFGVLVFTLFVLLLAYRLFPMVLRGDVLATGLAGALAGFLSVALFASLFDAPRLGFLFFLVAFAALLLPPEPGTRED